LAGEADLVDFLAGALLAEVFLAEPAGAFFAGVVVFLAGAADLLGFGGVDLLAVAFFAGVGAFFAGDLLAGVALFAAGFLAAGRGAAGAADAAPLSAAVERAGEVAGPVVPERVGWGWGCASRSMRTRAWMIPAAAMISPIRNHRRFTARTLIPLPRRPTDTTV
jgi:hypothetical protein